MARRPDIERDVVAGDDVRGVADIVPRFEAERGVVQLPASIAGRSRERKSIERLDPSVLAFFTSMDPESENQPLGKPLRFRPGGNRSNCASWCLSFPGSWIKPAGHPLA